MTGVYKIKNMIDGRIYIGSAINFSNRISRHVNLLKKNKHHSAYLQNSWNKYGEHNFIFGLIEQVEESEKLIVREQYWIDILKPEYNICPTAGSRLGSKATAETKAKISKNNSKYWLGKSISEEVRQKMSKSSKGCTHSDVTKKKISNSTRGENHPMYGMKHTTFSKKKMANAKSKPIEQYTLDKMFVREWTSGKEVQNELGFSQGNINKVCLGKYKQAYGFIWKFK
ncbi:MAG: NUMOD3 domain-containing DNA-binding protein [Nanoarchaeota archaeon]